jgi:hypothetical protein
MRASCGSSRPATPEPRNHLIQVWTSHRIGGHDRQVDTSPGLYAIRIKGRLGATALSAFPSMASELMGDETVLTGSIEDRSALFGVLAQIEALGLDLLELKQIRE